MAKSKKALSKFSNLLSETQDPELMELMLNLFFTPSERDFIAMRYEIVKELLGAKLSQREIAEKLGVSISKITAGSRELQTTPEKLITFLKKHYQKK